MGGPDRETRLEDALQARAQAVRELRLSLAELVHLVRCAHALGLHPLLARRRRAKAAPA